MIIEITTYSSAEGVTLENLMQASNDFNQNYCAKCKGLISRHFLKTDDGFMDIFTWQSKADLAHVQATFMEDTNAIAFAKHLNPKTLTMQNYEVLDSFEPN